MVGLTYTPPLLPSLAAQATPAGSGASQVIAQILSARAPGAIQDSLAETLQSAGTGNIVTGTVTATASDGSVTLTTANGTQISLHHPPELPLNLGSTVTLRIVSGGATPQAVILQVDGRPVALRQAPGMPPQLPLPPGAAVPPQPGQPPRNGAMPGADSASAYAATLAAVLSLEDEAAIDASFVETPLLVGNVEATEIGFLTEALIAILIHPAPARPGQSPLPVGTRYLMVPADAEDDASSESGPASAIAAAATTGAGTPARPALQGALGALLADLVSPEDAADFVPQSAVLAGRIVASPDPGQVLVETAIGTLALAANPALGAALAASASLPPGTAVRLRVAAVALPPASGSAAARPAPEERGLVDEIIELLTGGSAGNEALDAVLLPPDANLLATLWAILADPQRLARARTALAEMRQSLAATGREDLVERLDSAAGEMGDTRTGPPPEGWLITTLPFLGTDALRPLRLYTRKTGEREAGKENRPAGGDRFVLEVEFARLGAFQFDGLVRPRRLDLMLRTAAPLDADLAAGIETSFHDALSVCGWTGEIGFGRIGKFPLVPPMPPRSALTLSV